jgi:WD40 repeat protein
VKIRAYVGVVLLLVAACSSPTEGGDEVPGFEIELTSTPAATDTIGAPWDTLAVEVHDTDGVGVSGIGIQFSVRAGAGAQLPEVIIRTLDGETKTSACMTDASGQCHVQVERGLVTGVGWLKVSSPSVADSDSILVEVLPGAPSELRVEPTDTAVVVDNTYSLRAAVLDRAGNDRDEVVTFENSGTAISINAAAGLANVTGNEYGRASINVFGASLDAVSHVSVVPDGTLAVYDPGVFPLALATVRTDGSNYDGIHTTNNIQTGGWNLDWAPDGLSLALHMTDFTEPSQWLFRLVPGGDLERLISEDYEAYSEALPRHGNDGWIYYAASVLPLPSNAGELWRVRPDGSEAERVGPEAAEGDVDSFPDPSPDGLKLLFSTNRGASAADEARIAVLDLVSSEIDFLGSEGRSPVWSPDGEWIAFADPNAAVRVMAADGSNIQVISEPGREYQPWLSWSPDGRWVAAAGPGGLDIIDTQTQLTLPLPFGTQWRRPAWKP